MPRWRNSEAFDEIERAVLAWAEAMTSLPFAADDASFTEIRRRFEDRQIVELTAAIAWENFRARMNHALGIESQQFSACAVPWAGEAEHA